MARTGLEEQHGNVLLADDGRDAPAELVGVRQQSATALQHERTALVRKRMDGLEVIEPPRQDVVWNEPSQQQRRVRHDVDLAPHAGMDGPCSRALVAHGDVRPA